MLPPECSDLLMEEYMNNTEDAQTLQIQYKEMMADYLFVIPALQVAKFQREYICDETWLGGAQSNGSRMSLIVSRFPLMSGSHPLYQTPGNITSVFLHSSVREGSDTNKETGC